MSDEEEMSYSADKIGAYAAEFCKKNLYKPTDKEKRQCYDIFKKNWVSALNSQATSWCVGQVGQLAEPDAFVVEHCVSRYKSAWNRYKDKNYSRVKTFEYTDDLFFDIPPRVDEHHSEKTTHTSDIKYSYGFDDREGCPRSSHSKHGKSIFR